MKRIASVLLGVGLLMGLAPGMCAARDHSPAAATQAASPPQRRPSEPSNAAPPAAYTLTPERRAQAVAYSHALYILYFLGTLVSLGIYLFLWRVGMATAFRDWARRVSPRLFLQCLIYAPLLVGAATLLNFPLDFYSGFVLEHRFGLATQGFASWLGDWGKSLALVTVMAVVVVWIFYTVVRRSPRRWWFYFWLTSIPLVLAFILAEPYVVEPMFDKFTPLEKTQPALVERIEAMLAHAGLAIPRSSILEMDASSRTRAIDAYVSGLGSSKRVVVWDTTLREMSPDELLLVLGHETGHYVLHHIPKEFALDEGVALFFFYLGFLFINRVVARARARPEIEGLEDLASLPLVLAVLTVLIFFSDPLVNGISRHYEHQADQFGLEVAYGIVPDPNAAEVRALQILGEEDLSDPEPNPFIKFWLYTHPPLDERIRFAATYKPWAQGKPLELLPPAPHR